MEEQISPKKNRKKLVAYLGTTIILASSVIGYLVWQSISSRIYIDKAEIGAAMISLSPTVQGTLNEVMVHEGDLTSENQVVARVGDQLIKAKAPGLVIKAMNNSGKIINPGEAVVTVINPDDLRVIGHLEENKGFEEVKVGQRALFDVDAFGSKKYVGVVDEVSETSRESDIVFSISDKREAKKFDVKIRFNLAQNPELKNGMSAKAWIYK